MLDDDVLDEKVLEIKVFRVRVRLGVLEETEDELDGLLGPATFRCTRLTPFKNTEMIYDAPLVVLNCFAWLARPVPPANRRKGMTCLWSWTSLRYAYAFVSLRPERSFTLQSLPALPLP